MEDDGAISSLCLARQRFLQQFLGGPDAFAKVAKWILKIQGDEERNQTARRLSEIIEDTQEPWCESGPTYREEVLSKAANRCTWILRAAGLDVDETFSGVLKEWLEFHVRHRAELKAEFERSLKETAQQDNPPSWEECARQRAYEARVMFMRKRVRRGTCFSVQRIAKALDISEKHARRRRDHIFSNSEIAAILGVTVEDVGALMAQEVSPTLLNALARHTKFRGDTFRELWEPRPSRPDERPVPAAASSGLQGSNVDLRGLRVAEKLSRVVAKLESSRPVRDGRKKPDPEGAE